MAKMSKGVIVEFDFTVLNGAEILFDTAKKLLKGAGVELNARLEALHLAGGNYQGGLAELFEATGHSGDAAALARELNTAFNSAVAAKAADAVTPAFKSFLKTLADKGLKVVVATRGDAAALAAAIGDDRDRIERIYGSGYLDITDLNRLPIMLTQLIARNLPQ